MADYIKQVMTADGPKQIDYTALANLPIIDSTVKDGSTNAVQSNAVYDALAGKLGINATAADSAKFGGQAPEYYATATELVVLKKEVDTGIVAAMSETKLSIEQIKTQINSPENGLDTKLDKDAQAVDSAKLGGKLPEYYATKEEVDAAMPIAGGKAFTGDVQAYSVNRDTSSLRNIEIRVAADDTDGHETCTGALQSTNKIIMIRK